MMKQLMNLVPIWIREEHGKTLCVCLFAYGGHTNEQICVCLNVLLCVPVFFFFPKSGEKSIIWYKAICSASFAFNSNTLSLFAYICTIFIIQKIHTFLCGWNSFHFESARTKIYEKNQGSVTGHSSFHNKLKFFSLENDKIHMENSFIYNFKWDFS